MGAFTVCPVICYLYSPLKCKFGVFTAQFCTSLPSLCVALLHSGVTLGCREGQPCIVLVWMILIERDKYVICPLDAIQHKIRSCIIHWIREGEMWIVQCSCTHAGVQQCGQNVSLHCHKVPFFPCLFCTMWVCLLLAGFCRARKTSDCCLLFTLFKTTVAGDFFVVVLFQQKLLA